MTDPDDHAVRHHQPKRLRDAGLPLQPQALHHCAPPGEECQEAHHEHGQEATGNTTTVAFLSHPVYAYNICSENSATSTSLYRCLDALSGCHEQ